MDSEKKTSSVGKFLLSFGLIIVSTVYAVWQSIVGQSTPSTSLSTPRSMMSLPMMRFGQYRDGTYTGNAVDAFYGILQVQAVIQGGRIADVKFLQYANNTDNSRFINDQAMPMLTQEAIQAQSAQVNGVSGATATSDAFVQSLASALAQAK